MVVALMLAGCIFAGFSIDVGHVYLVKGELQNAADATALAGADAIYYENSNLHWDAVLPETDGFIGKNRADGKALTTCQVERGFWNISTATAEPLGSGSTATGVCYDTGAACSDDDDCVDKGGCRQFKFPYVKVTVGKTAGQNGGPVENDGPVPTLFARVIGWNGFHPRASAIAISGSPGSVPTGVLFPFVITQPYKNQFFGLATVRRLDMPLEDGKVAGQWSDLSAGNSINTDDVRHYIDYLAGVGNKGAPALSVNQTLHIEPVANASPYTAARNLIEAGKGTVLMPVVSEAASGNSMVVVKGFIAVELMESDPVNNILRGRLVGEYDLPPGVAPGGEITNVVIHPKLVH